MPKNWHRIRSSYCLSLIHLNEVKLHFGLFWNYANFPSSHKHVYLVYSAMMCKLLGIHLKSWQWQNIFGWQMLKISFKDFGVWQHFFGAHTDTIQSHLQDLTVALNYCGRTNQVVCYRGCACRWQMGIWISWRRGRCVQHVASVLCSP